VNGEGGDQAVHFIYLVGFLVLVVSALMVRRIPLGQGLKMFAGWVLIFAAAFILFTFRHDFQELGSRLLVEARGGEPEVQQTEGGEELRIRQSADGHFWVNAEVNGERVRFLIDSGATMTSISQRTADRVGVEPLRGFRPMVRTAAGVIQVDRGRVDSLEVGTIQRTDMPVHISDLFGDMNVLGMNFLSSLSGWGVESRTLILRP
jgi:aspartyl protease family protein